MTEPKYQIGMNEELGGYVIYVTPDGEHGLIVAMQDQGDYIYRVNIINEMIRDKDNYPENARNNLVEWHLPCLPLLWMICQNKEFIDGLEGNTFWSANGYMGDSFDGFSDVWTVSAGSDRCGVGLSRVGKVAERANLNKIRAVGFFYISTFQTPQSPCRYPPAWCGNYSSKSA